MPTDVSDIIRRYRRAKKVPYNIAYYERLKADPERYRRHVDQSVARHRERYRDDPNFRAWCAEYNREYRERNADRLRDYRRRWQRNKRARKIFQEYFANPLTIYHARVTI